MTRCCNNCDNLTLMPRKNAHGDIDCLCMATGYFVHGRDKDISTVRRYTPGGRELKCQWKEAKK